MRTGDAVVREPAAGRGEAPTDAGSAGTPSGGALRKADIQEKKVSSAPVLPAPTAASQIVSRVSFGALRRFLPLPRSSSALHAVSRPSKPLRAENDLHHDQFMRLSRTIVPAEGLTPP
jgi:hypothetical protein